ncbi:MAG: tRNA pseudouridine(38-40) synthase TruA [Alphaproteobacteria bacterium]
MPRYKIILEYDGTPFVGWQRQNNGVSVQGVVEAAIKAFSGESVTITAAGRTDTGVHARGQVASFDLERAFPSDTVRDAINAHVRPHLIAVLSAAEVVPNFSARFSAIKRYYEYRVITRRAPLALDTDRAWWIPQGLDVGAMTDAAQALIGQHDFTTFRAAECQAKSPVKTLDEARVESQGESIVFNFSARSFLHSQVRSMVGSLVQVGRGKWNPADLRKALEARDRAECGPLAPPCGLTLLRVDYPN